MTKLFDFAITEFRIIFPLMLAFSHFEFWRSQRQGHAVCKIKTNLDIFFPFSGPVVDAWDTDKIEDQHSSQHHGLDAVPHRVRGSPRPGLQRRLFHTHEPDRQ